MPKKPKKVEIPQRIKRIVETCKLGQKVCLTIRHSDVGDERLYWFEPSGRPAGTKSVEQAIEKGLLVPCHDGLFDLSQIWVAA
jgi:hypothetical protein